MRISCARQGPRVPGCGRLPTTPRPPQNVTGDAHISHRHVRSGRATKWPAPGRGRGQANCGSDGSAYEEILALLVVILPTGPRRHRCRFDARLNSWRAFPGISPTSGASHARGVAPRKCARVPKIGRRTRPLSTGQASAPGRAVEPARRTNSLPRARLRHVLIAWRTWCLYGKHVRAWEWV